MADDRNERFAALIQEGRPGVLRTFARRLEEAYGFVPDNGLFLEQAMATASDVISDVVRSVRAAQVRIRVGPKAGAWAIVRAGREECLSPADSLGADVMLLSTVLAVLTAYVSADQDLMACFTIAVTALNESVSKRMQAVAGACAVDVLDRVHRAEVEERRHIARELHDRVGEALSIGLRKLDLLEIAEGPVPPGQAAVAREVVVEAMRRLRVVTSDLREPPVTSLEKALTRYLESARADAEVRLYVSGDEAWAPPAVLDEVFLILREAVRNALTHGAPQLLAVGVEFSERELTARVIDDGCGFSPAQVTGCVGMGLASMRERAALMRGRLMVSSMPGHGTRVELYLPLPDQDPGA